MKIEIINADDLEEKVLGGRWAYIDSLVPELIECIYKRDKQDKVFVAKLKKIINTLEGFEKPRYSVVETLEVRKDES